MTEKKKTFKTTVKIICIIIFIVAILLFFLYVLIPNFSLKNKTIKVIKPIDKSFSVEEYFKYSGMKCEELLNEEEINTVIQDSSKSCINIIQSKLNSAPLQLIRLSNLNVPRANPETIALNNGNALIIGGNSKDSVELYNSKTKNFQLIPFKQKSFNNCCPEIIYMPNDNVYYKGLIYLIKENKFVELPKTFKKHCNRLCNTFPNILNQPLSLIQQCGLCFSKTRILESYEDGFFLVREFFDIKKEKQNNQTIEEICGKNLSSPPESSEVYLYDYSNNTRFKAVKFGEKDFIEDVLRLDKYRFLFKISRITSSQDLKNYLFLYDAQTGKSEELKLLDTYINKNTIQNIIFHKESNSLIFDVPIIASHSVHFTLSNTVFDYIYIYSYNLTTKKIEKIANLPLNKGFKNLPYRAILFDQNYILYVNVGIIYILDLTSSSTSIIFNSNINPYFRWDSSKKIYLQAFTCLSSGNILISGGYIEDQDFNKTIIYKSKFTAIIKNKEI